MFQKPTVNILIAPERNMMRAPTCDRTALDAWCLYWGKNSLGAHVCTLSSPRSLGLAFARTLGGVPLLGQRLCSQWCRFQPLSHVHAPVHLIKTETNAGNDLGAVSPNLALLRTCFAINGDRHDGGEAGPGPGPDR